MLALALLTFYLERAVREDETPTAARRHDPDYYVVNFTTTTYNPEGAAETRMSAERMVHYPDDDTTGAARAARAAVQAQRAALQRARRARPALARRRRGVPLRRRAAGARGRPSTVPRRA
jgi:LPS export ABC transporter protein LptC